MGRTLKRVPMDFDWPLGEVWKGYLHSDHKQTFAPPAGEGFQLWETTTEGSPVSPVFETLDGLCDWCEENATVFADIKATKEQWKQMFDSGSICARVGNIVVF